MLEEPKLSEGLSDIRLGNLRSDACLAVLTQYMELVRKTFPLHFLPPSSTPYPRADERELALKADIEATFKISKVSWRWAPQILQLIQRRLFTATMLEMLPIVNELGCRCQHDGKTIWRCITDLSNKFPDRYEPVRALFRDASPEDKERIVLLLRAQLMFQYDDRNLMVASHCDKWPPCLELIEEFRAEIERS